MTTRTDFTVEWDLSPRIITIAAPSTEATIQDIVDTLRVIEHTVRGMSEPKLINATGKEPLGGGINVGITCSLQNALLAFEDRAGPAFEQMLINGGNLVAFDEFGAVLDSPIQTTTFTQVVVTSSSSATLQEQIDIEFASFSGGVTIDAINGTAGTTFPQGTARAPVDNLSDAQTIAAVRGFKTYYLVGDFTFDAADSISQSVFIGQSAGLTQIMCTAAATISSCEFHNAKVTGTLDGESALIDCAIFDLFGVQGLIQRCDFLPGTLTLSGSAEAHFINCFSGVPGGGATDHPHIDFNGSGTAVLMRNYSGSLHIHNKTGTDKTSIDFISGRLGLGSNVTAGNISVRGVVEIDDQSTGTATLDVSGVVNTDLNRRVLLSTETQGAEGAGTVRTYTPSFS